jgi:hypothetical protein
VADMRIYIVDLESIFCPTDLDVIRKHNLQSLENLNIYASNSNPYTGYYFKTSTGKYFTGRNQDDRPNEELNVITNQVNTIQNTANPIPQTSIALAFEGAFPQNANVSDDYKDPTYSEDLVLSYLNIQKISLNNLPSYIIPTYNPVLPTQQDYQNGEFRRYFCKKTNEIIFKSLN